MSWSVQRMAGRLVLARLAAVILLLAATVPSRADSGTIYLDLNPLYDQVVNGRLVLGPSDGLSFDQPRGPIEVIDAATQTSLGPFDNPLLPPNERYLWNNDVLFDTGANTVMIVGQGATGLAPEFQTVGQFIELGVAGTETFSLSAGYQLDFAGSDGVRQTLSNTQLLTNTNLNFGSFYGILGMPGMVGRVTSTDLTPLANWLTNPEYIKVYFAQGPNALPAGSGHRYSIPVDTRTEFYPGYGIPEDVEGVPNSPIWAHVPFLTATVTLGGEEQTGGFLFDTGAQVSMISERAARELLGIGAEVDIWDYAIDALPVGGIGGEVVAPVLAFDEIRVMTNEGVELVWTDLQLCALNIADGIDGVFGHDFMTSGYINLLGDKGFIEEVHYDFRDFKLVTRGPADANFDGVVDDLDAAVLAANWLQSTDRGWQDGDFNNDGVVDDRDAAILAAHWQRGGEGDASVPEPGAWALLLTALLPGLAARRRLSLGESSVSATRS